MHRKLIVVAVALALGGACGDPQTTSAGRPEQSSSPIPERLDVVCHQDGSTELLNRAVRALPDGVHVRVDNRAGEFVSINGAGLDASEDVTEQTARTPPGELKVACWPGSKHEEPEPERLAVQIHDPNGYWTSGELECPEDGLIGNSHLDYASGGSGTYGDPEDLARTTMEGIEDADAITTVGYPEGEPREVAVERNDKRIAVLSFGAAQKGGWYLAGYSTCANSGIKY
jgi:hypothetical protein